MTAEWQPIGTAPRDGTKIIYITRFGEIGFCHWDEAYNDDDESLWWDSESDDEVFPIGWLPRSSLPPQPAFTKPKLSEAKEEEGAT